MRGLPWILLFPLILALCGCMGGDAVLIATASSMREPVEEIVEAFELESGQSVRLSFGPSGTFFSQILNGAPFDVFLAADSEYPQQLEEAELIEPGSLSVYAVGHIVVWIREGLPPRLDARGMEALLDPSIERVAIANPRLAPYGRAAVSAMEHYGVYDQVQPRLVMGESIAQAAQFGASGAVDAGILALSLAATEPMRQAGRYWEVPETAHPPIQHAMVILKQARLAGHDAAAYAFSEFLHSDTSRAVLERYGFTVP